MKRFHKVTIVFLLSLFFVLPSVTYGATIFDNLLEIIGLNNFLGEKQLAAPSSNKILTRDITIDTQGKSLITSNEDSSQDGKMLEYLLGVKIKDWKIKYEKKVHSRGVCEPPVLNISFDKADSKGNPKELFTGMSTYLNYDKLQYQKIRLIPDCDVWNEYFSSSDVGFSGQSNVLLREYTIHKIFREFGIPAADVIGIANIKFVTPDSRYDGKTFRYLIIQRPQEKDDQIPFTTQFNFHPGLYESGDKSLWFIIDRSDSENANIVPIENRVTGQKVNIEFDKNAALKFRLLTEFLGVGDMGFLHNEDGGIDKTTGLVKSIPHGFDASFSCYSVFVNPRNVTNEEKGFYSIARDIFLNSKNLDRMLEIVDNFSYTNVGEQKLKEYLKLEFYNYASYFNSVEFARDMGRDHKPIAVSLPFTSEEEYSIALDRFNSTCNKVQVDLTGTSVSVVGNPSLTLTKDDIVAEFVVDIKTTNSALQVYKFNSSFESEWFISGEKLENQGTYLYVNPEYGVEDQVGPYYVIPPNTTARFRLTDFGHVDDFIKGTYSMRLKSFKPNGNFKDVLLNYKTNDLIFGNLSPITIKSPKVDDILSIGEDYNITFNASLDRYLYMWLVDRDGNFQGYISNPIQPEENDDNSYKWNVGKVYTYSPDGLSLINIDPGMYKIVISYDDGNVKDGSGLFEIIDPKKPKQIIVTHPTLEDVFERGKSYEIKFKSNGVGSVNVDLMDFKGLYLIRNIDKDYYVNDSEESFWWRVPSDLDTDKNDNFVIRITDAKNPSLKGNSRKFAVVEINEPLITVKKNLLKLNYDGNNKESSLSMTSEVIITANKNENLIIPAKYPFYVYARSTEEGYMYGDVTYTSKSPIKNSKDGQYYEISKGQSATFYLTTIFTNLKQQFPGVYIGHIGGFSYGKNHENFKLTSDNSSNPVAIIGETSPYINFIDYPIGLDKVFTIKGVRFGNGELNLVLGKDKIVKVIPKRVGNEDTVTFVPENVGIGKGWLNLYLVHPTEGESNIVSIEIL